MTTKPTDIIMRRQRNGQYEMLSRSLAGEDFRWKALYRQRHDLDRTEALDVSRRSKESKLRVAA